MFFIAFHRNYRMKVIEQTPAAAILSSSPWSAIRKVPPTRFVSVSPKQSGRDSAPGLQFPGFFPKRVVEVQTPDDAKRLEVVYRGLGGCFIGVPVDDVVDLSQVDGVR
jgi:hypothetical protein